MEVRRVAHGNHQLPVAETDRKRRVPAQYLPVDERRRPGVDLDLRELDELQTKPRREIPRALDLVPASWDEGAVPFATRPSAGPGATPRMHPAAGTVVAPHGPVVEGNAPEL